MDLTPIHSKEMNAEYFSLCDGLPEFLIAQKIEKW